MLESVTSFFRSIKSALETEQGAYWCEECNERKPGSPDENSPNCPSCGDPMKFKSTPPDACC